MDIMTFRDILFVELSTFSSEISHFFPLPYRRSFCRMTERSRLKSFSSYKNRFLVIRMLLSKLVLREPCRFLFCFEFLHSSGVFKCLNCLRFLFFLILSLLMTDWFLFVWQFFLVLNSYEAVLTVSKATLQSNLFSSLEAVLDCPESCLVTIESVFWNFFQ